ncbi:adenosylcobalamin-dependent ribonucleoside-diphosphate reductase [Algoriphagus sp. CAU 1675]|uniref:adenosylcobalamin-dependent ribonucleoside-diphosphate reductase n=1 Tax=Algoriphagus sp. CAU 1675 TaxID=3032597 RepID=UPI0023D9924D|nr:adenosylcobalamin-dependent ribonucleoside-diphosphate reductase [Algoriphagus sp. CAU 1675]MDF2157270.1 adenosylcobalamin-dependent ribonucleoside-diphosphate reductase [Algoriphagus sp. CAU 1675]
MKSLSENALKILRERYLLRNAQGKTLESPEGMFRRVAKAVAKAEENYAGKEAALLREEEFFEMMAELDFLPNSTTLMNAGTGYGQLSACFVLPVEDSLNGIFETLKLAAMVQQKGGGTGFNFSKLRPAGDFVSGHGGQSSGPVSFIKLFDFATEHIKQGGRRRGANMGILNIDHPDIFEFIGLRSNGKRLRNFNLSVAVSDAFMHALEKGEEWELINPRTQKVARKVSASMIWKEIVYQAWLSGNPGLIFTDTIQQANPVPSLGKIEATNPCGEVPLLPYESCNLGSINLSHYGNRESRKIDWERLKTTVKLAVRFLDDVLEINKFPSSSIKKATLANRKIGLGVMGWAELLIQLRIPYASEEAVELGAKLMKFIQDQSFETSSELAKERGCFPNWEKSKYFPDHPMRNATQTSVAPTGTISILADTSSSIEPLFALAFQRKNVLQGETLKSINPLFMEMLQDENLLNDSILEKVFEKGSCLDIQEIPKNLQEVFRTALEVSPEWHLRHQVAFQNYTDNAVSKTVNLPSTANVEEVEDLYKKAWREKAKGITVFRNESGDQQLLYRGIKSTGPEFKTCIR